MTWKTRPRSERSGLAWIEQGAGPSVLLLHGVGLRAEAWNAQVDALTEAGFHVLAPDMLGHGSSSAPPAPASLSDFVQPVANLIRSPVVIAGHSMGAMMALELAARHPEKVKGVIALNAIYRRSSAARQAVQARAGGLDGRSPVVAGPTLDRWFGAAPSPARDACADWLQSMQPEGYKAAYSVFANEDGPSDDTLKSLGCPALFMTGADEPNSTPQMSRAMAALAPEGRAEIVADAAHMMPMTHADQVNAALVRHAQECLS